MSSTQDVLGSTILNSLQGGISYITLNRPDAGNALLPNQRGVICRLLADASQDPEIRAVVLKSNGKHFCAGADMHLSASLSGAKKTEAKPQRPGEHARSLMHGQESVQNLIAAILDCSKPVVAAVQGAAVGMGAEIALACDLIVASNRAYFSQIFIRRGILIDAGCAYLLPRRIGLQKAKELVFFGENLSATEAEKIGLINKAVPEDEFASAVDDFAQRLAQGPTTAISLAKQLLNRSLESNRATAFLEEALAAEINGRTDDIKEGISAFIDRRPPNFKGY